MPRLDTWKPRDSEAWDKTLDDLLPTDAPEVIARRAEILIRKAKDLRARKLFIERRATKRDSFDHTKGECQYCLEPTAREFCNQTCERKAALAVLPLKFETG
jgi:hypothetical protein